MESSATLWIDILTVPGSGFRVRDLAILMDSPGRAHRDANPIGASTASTSTSLPSLLVTTIT